MLQLKIDSTYFQHQDSEEIHAVSGTSKNIEFQVGQNAEKVKYFCLYNLALRYCCDQVKEYRKFT